MLATKTKPKAESAVPDFQTAKARWAEVDAKHREMIERLEGMKLAVSFAKSGIAKRTPQTLRDQADPYMKLATGRPDKMASQYNDLVEDIADFTPKLQVERELWQTACRGETGRIARDLQPRHRAAVKRIAKAMEALSLAMADEMDIHAELARTAPEPSSAYLPNCVAELTIGTLADWNSPASHWARRMREIRILE